MFRTKNRSILAIATAATLTLAACGSDADSEAEETESSSESTAETETSQDSTEDTSDGEAEGEGEGETEAEGEGEAEPLRIGFLPPTLGIPAFQGLQAGLEGYGGGRYGDTVESIDAMNDPTIQVQTVRQWTELDQVDAIWIIPVAGDAVAQPLEEAIAAGIPIIATGIPADYGWDGLMPGITFATVDNVAFGGGVGDLMAECINERLDGEAEVIYVGPGDVAESTTFINESSKAALAEGAPDATIVQELIAAADVAGTRQLVESALQANPDSNALMAGDAEAAMAGLNAYVSAGKDATEICVSGSGGEDDQIASIEAGEMWGTVAFDFEADLTQNVDELHRLAADTSVEGLQLTIPINIVRG